MSKTTRRLPHTVRKETEEEIIAFWGEGSNYIPRMIRFNNRLGRDGGCPSDIREPFSKGRNGLGWDGASGETIKRSWKRQVSRFNRRGEKAMINRNLLDWGDDA